MRVCRRGLGILIVCASTVGLNLSLVAGSTSVSECGAGKSCAFPDGAVHSFCMCNPWVGDWTKFEWPSRCGSMDRTDDARLG